jgi:ribonucleoside-diphosphate reductase alpha chain
VTTFGPKLKISQQLHSEKYRLPGESFEESMCRIASALADDGVHEAEFRDCLLNQRFLPAGRIQTGAGSGRAVALCMIPLWPVKLSSMSPDTKQL